MNRPPFTEEKHAAYRRALAELAESTERLKKHNDETEARERMRARGSVPPNDGYQVRIGSPRGGIYDLGEGGKRR